jgi:regulator of protease activity HflC (stomatin/prohibitin superfamily)
MDEQTGARIVAIEERITVVETEVAVIQSNYVRKDHYADRHSDLRDDFAAMRLENQKAHAENRAMLNAYQAELLAVVAKVAADNQAAIAKVSADNQAAIAEVRADNQAAVAEVRADNQVIRTDLRREITKMGMTILMWMFVMLIGFSGLLLAVIKEMR